MIEVLEILIVISLLKGAYYDSQCGIDPAAIDLLACLAVMVFEIRREVKKNEKARKGKAL